MSSGCLAFRSNQGNLSGAQGKFEAANLTSCLRVEVTGIVFLKEVDLEKFPVLEIS